MRCDGALLLALGLPCLAFAAPHGSPILNRRSSNLDARGSPSSPDPNTITLDDCQAKRGKSTCKARTLPYKGPTSNEVPRNPYNEWRLECVYTQDSNTTAAWIDGRHGRCQNYDGELTKQACENDLKGNVDGCHRVLDSARGKNLGLPRLPEEWRLRCSYDQDRETGRTQYKAISGDEGKCTPTKLLKARSDDTSSESTTSTRSIATEPPAIIAASATTTTDVTSVETTATTTSTSTSTAASARTTSKPRRKPLWVTAKECSARGGFMTCRGGRRTCRYTDASNTPQYQPLGGTCHPQSQLDKLDGEDRSRLIRLLLRLLDDDDRATGRHVGGGSSTGRRRMRSNKLRKAGGRSGRPQNKYRGDSGKRRAGGRKTGNSTAPAPPAAKWEYTSPRLPSCDKLGGTAGCAGDRVTCIYRGDNGKFHIKRYKQQCAWRMTNPGWRTSPVLG